MTLRTNYVVFTLLLFLLSALADIANAQTQRTEHTFKLDNADARPPATLDDVSWLVGNWAGEAFGSKFEEGWNPPSAGSMIGFFKLIGDDGVAFYELLLLVEEEGSLSLKVKHFSADFAAWEDKEDYVQFRFIKAEEDAAHFSGISFYRIDENTLHGYIVMRSGEDVREEKLVYRRQ
ncbi:MAG: DUF6265 family protein [Gammaproteobacteria bacterium]|nr:DUF6265 family protein [Gammaproteobacteria bacterium]MDH3373511.1 DUF6265 family protein [Gammaproteobacteria bacterium]MDH3409230.1 DUF6265 family protein [Gammaproteobacteria bacterium]MDH3553636.1 DUF6265 family protein [Gammaproteobacteria bacterium]